jgi:hypothetical protein
VAGYKYEIERLTSELADLKRRWFDAKRREQQQGLQGQRCGASGGVTGRPLAGAGDEQQQGEQQQAGSRAGVAVTGSGVAATKAPLPPPAVKGGGFAMA